MYPYCQIEWIKTRVLISDNDTTFDTLLNTAANEATDLVNLFLEPYDSAINITTGSVFSNPTLQVQEITADFGASIFKRRHLPEGDIQLQGVIQPEGDANQIVASGYFGMALRKLEDYIKFHYGLKGNPVVNMNNGPIIMALLKQGIIKLNEARSLLNNTTTVIWRIERTYQTRKQNYFGFIQGNNVASDGTTPDGSGTGGYKSTEGQEQGSD